MNEPPRAGPEKCTVRVVPQVDKGAPDVFAVGGEFRTFSGR